MERVIRGSGGGCFRKGSLVQLEHNKTVAIEELKVGDEILSFDEKGEICLSKVTKTHYHEEVEPLILVKFWNGFIEITSNHWVQNQYGSFVEIGTLTIDDAIVDGMGHLRPIITISSLEPEPVYNLTVEPNHTFICNNVRVHNGGHRNRYPVVGSGGGGDKGGGGRVAVEAPDSLQSRAYANVLDLICEGEIEGLVNGAQSIYLDEVPLQNLNGTYNFSGAIWDFRNGTQDQKYIPGFRDTQSVSQVGVQIKGYTPANDPAPEYPAVPVTRRYTNVNTDGVIVTIAVPALQVQDMSTGDVNGTTVQLQVEQQFNNGGFVPSNINAIWNEITTVEPIVVTNTKLLTPVLVFQTSFKNLWNTILTNSDLTFNETVGYIIGATTTQIKANIVFEHHNTSLSEETPTYEDIIYKVEESSDNGSTWSTIKIATKVYEPTPVAYNSIFDYWFTSSTNLDNPFTHPQITPSEEVYTTIGSVLPRKLKITILSGGAISACQGYSASYNNTITISGKASSKYQRSFFVPFTQQGTWDIRVSRITNESTSQALQNETWWDLETEVIYGKLGYPNSAIAALSVDASQFGSIPQRAYDVKLLKILIPTNYNPLTRRYNRDKDTGISSGDDKVWDGTFYVAWSNNPAWCFYDLVTNDRYGLGSFIDSTKVDKWALYEIGKYCDELVPAGKFGMVEPRFTCNLYIQTREDAFKVINDMASVFRGMVYWASGAITAIQDSPSDPVYLFNQTNVVDGIFTYSGSSAKARHTVALVSWNDMTDMCRVKVEYVEDALGIEKYGVIESSIVAVGCTSQGQAHRVGKWLLQSELSETEVVSFKTGIEGAGAVVRPGAIIAIADPIRAGDRLGGRILQVIDDYTIVIDNGLTTVSIGNQIPVFDTTMFDDKIFDCAQTDGLDTISIFDTSGNVHEVGIASISGTTITFNTPVENMYVGSLWIISTNEVNKQLFRILSVVEDKGTFEVSAIEHNPDKYNSIEYNISLQEKPISNLSIYPEAPVGLNLTESLYLGNGNVLVKISASWEPVANTNSYIVAYKAANGNMSPEMTVYTPQIDIPNVIEGITYSVLVWTVGAAGNRSLSYATATITVQGKMIPPINITNLSAQVYENKVKLNWDDNTELDFSNYEVRISDINWGTDSNYLYNGNISECIVNAPLPNTSTTYYVKSKDTSGNYSTTATSIIFNTEVVPSIFLGGISVDFQDTSTSSASIFIQWQPVNPQFGLKYYKFVNGTNNPIYVNSNFISIPADWQNDRSIYISVIDSNNRESTVTEKVITINLPGQVPVPDFALTKVSGEVVMNFSWVPSTQGTLPISGYEIRSSDIGWGNTSYIYRGSSNTAIVPNIISSLGQTWYIRAFDTRNNYSSISRSMLLDDLVPPAVPTNFSASNSISGLTLSWTESTTLDVVAYEIRVLDSGWGMDDASRLYYGSDTSKVINLTNTGTYNFYIKARDVSNQWSTATTTQFIYTAVTPININDTQVQFIDDQATSASVKVSWADPITQFGIKQYRITYDSIDFIQLANNVTIPANWIGSKDLNIYVIDNNNISSVATTKTITRYKPATLTGISGSVSDTRIMLSWSTPTVSSNSGYLPIAGYEVRLIDEDWGLGNSLYKGNSTNVLVTPSINGNGTWYIKPYDTDNEYSTTATSYTFTPQTVPNILSITHDFFDTSTTSATITLEWNNVSPEFGLKHYKVVYGTKTYTSNSNIIILPADWVGDRTYTVYTVDNLNRESSGFAKVITKLKPNPPSSFYPQVIDNTVMLTWSAPSPTTLPVSHYNIREGSAWATAYDLGRKDGMFTTITELAKGTYTYWICTVDTDGVESDPIQRTCEVAEPPDFVYHGQLFANYQVIDDPNNGNTIASTYTNAKYDQYGGVGSVVLPVNTTEQYQQHFTSLRVFNVSIVSGGSNYNIGDIIEVNGGTYTHKSILKVLAVSSGVVTSLSISSPGNYTVAPTSNTSTTNLSGVGVGLTITPSTHSWQAPQADIPGGVLTGQITDGYTKFISPTLSSGSYQETWDIGTILGSSKIVVGCDTADSTAITLIPTIEITSTTGSSWTTADPNYKSYPGAWEVFGVNFRYIRLTIAVANTDYNEVIRFYNLNVLLNAKAISDSGTTLIDSQGYVVNFGKEFIDVTSLTVTPNTTTPLVTVYDYKDTVLPPTGTGTYSVTSNQCTFTATGHGLISGQAISLYVSSGGGISGKYTITSYTTNTFTFTMTTANTSGNAIAYPQSFRIYLFDSSSGSPPTFGTYNVSWFAKGY